MNDMVDIAGWYVVQTQVNAEAKAARNLVRQDFEIYLPRYLKRRSHARKIEKVAARQAGRLLVAKVNTEALGSLGERLGIRSIPTMAVYQNGREIARTTGARPAGRAAARGAGTVARVPATGPGTDRHLFSANRAWFRPGKFRRHRGRAQGGSPGDFPEQCCFPGKHGR